MLVWIIARKKWPLLGGMLTAFLLANAIALAFDPLIFQHYREMLRQEGIQNHLLLLTDRSEHYWRAPTSQERTTVNKCTRAVCSTRSARYQKKGREAVSNGPRRFVSNRLRPKLRHNREMRVVFGTPLPL